MITAAPEAGDGFAPEDPAFVADPYPVYAELRRDRPVCYDAATDHWLITRHADVNALLRDRRFGRTYLHVASHEAMGRPAPPAWHEPFWRLINAGILDMEATDHTRVRRLVSKAFTPGYVEGLRPRVQAIVDGLLSQIDDTGVVDLLPTVAEPLPVTVIAEMLGVPQGRAVSPPAVVGGHLPHVRAPSFARVAAGGGPRQHRVLRLPPRPRPGARTPAR